MDHGPKLGDAASLWNFTPSPGWTKEEVVALKLALGKFGVGRWVQIVDSGVLPGKLIQQLNGQTQRLLGQQSLAAFTGLHIDVDAVRKDNEAKQGEDVIRKSGLIINSGGTTDRATMEQMRRENEKKYGLSKEYVDSIVLPSPVKTAQTATLERQAQAGGHRAKAKQAKATVKLSLMSAPLDALSDGQCRALLLALHTRLHSLLAAAPGAAAAPADAPAPKRGRAPAKPKEAAAGGDAPKKRAKAGAGGAGAGTGVEQLIGMGFDPKKAADALVECNNDLSAAVAWLFQNCA